MNHRQAHPETTLAHALGFTLTPGDNNANTGIGKETAKELARRKARVIIACRNLQKAEMAAREIFEETQQPVVIKPLDLASLTSVRAFAEDIMRTESRLDVLINNAGVMVEQWRQG
ncbi:hypothetical protein HPB47_007742 [Ixodes persulcatus]|uniref:Uncharacterized protein n=1 Tax=Ixodes persulcatus TaxID=34615 RepID=A0AC60P6K3_IXOPE|nr:hypothetical protein HPB47_007742 [Ixodes persulcatus]